MLVEDVCESVQSLHSNIRRTHWQEKLYGVSRACQEIGRLSFCTPMPDGKKAQSEKPAYAYKPSSVGLLDFLNWNQ